MDPRIERTQKSLQDALLHLARDNNLDDISIAQIVEQAGVNRSSFYQHYQDKDVLLADALDRRLIELTDSLLSRGIDASTLLPQQLSNHIVHIKDHAAVYCRALGPNGSSVVANQLTARIEESVRRTADLIAPDDQRGVPTDIIAGALAGTILAVIIGWLRREGPLDVTEVESWITATLTHPLASWLDADASYDTAKTVSSDAEQVFMPGGHRK